MENERMTWSEEEYLRHRAYCLTYDISAAISDCNFGLADRLRDEQDAIRRRVYGWTDADIREYYCD